jgi:phosphohistidine phosphatase
MKKVYYTRHGKSSWDDPFQKDFDRPLKKRGRKDAKLIGSVLKKEGHEIDVIFSSSAQRAKETAVIFQEVMDIPFITFFVDLYHASDRGVLDFLSKIETTPESIMVFGHNPGYTNLVNRYSDQHLYNLPTTGTFCVEYDCDCWSEIKMSKGVLKGIWIPKNYK